MQGSGAGSGADGLTLGVKSRLSNQEMETLRAKATAYDHAACDAKRAERHTRALLSAKPMTKIYRRRTDEREDQEPASSSSFRPGRKTLASIRYEAAFSDAACDALRVRPPVSKGISAAAKTRLQDEYVTRPRHVSSIPVSLMGGSGDDDRDGGARAAKSGKRAAPAAIPQVFIA